MPNKLRKFCKISKYLEKNDKELYQIFDDLCLFPLLRVRNKGVTFLRPVDKAFRKKLINETYSATPEKAVDMIRALVLYDFLPSASAFKDKVIPNALKRQLGVDKITGQKVSLKSGHTIELDSGFSTLRHGDLAAVYKLSGKGPLPTDGAVVTLDGPKRTIAGGDGHPSRKSLGIFVESTYANGGANKNIYRAVMACLYKCSLNAPETVSSVFDTMCASARASFYALVEPHAKNKPNSPLDTIIVEASAIIRNNYPECLSKLGNKYHQFRNELISKVKPDRQSVVSAYNALESERVELLKMLRDDRKVKFREAVVRAYGGNQAKCAKDMLTVYCFLSARNEDHDHLYFKDCFCWVMRNIYGNPEEILSHHNEIAFVMSVVANLVKSDAYKHEPFLGGIGGEKHAGFNTDDIPDPIDLSSRFCIETSIITEKHGGGQSLDDFINS